MITINGTAISTPSQFSVSIEDVSKADRNANATIIIERIATKRKLELSYNYLSNSALSTLLSAISTDVFFTVVYPDPWTGANRSGTFYVGSRSAGSMDYIDSTIRWKDIKFNFIEQ